MEISYAGQNLRESKKTLWTVSFTIKNTGNAEIKKGDFDDEAPLGLQFKGAELVESPTLKTDIDYLSNNLKIRKTANSITLSPAIFEPGDEMQISALLLGSDVDRPTMSPLGKVAGIKTIKVLDIDQKVSKKSALEMIFGAENLWVQPVRLIAYFFGFFLALGASLFPVALLAAPIDYIRTRRQKKVRENAVFDARRKTVLNEIEEKFIEFYEDHGDEILKKVWGYVCKTRRRKDLALALQGHVSDELVSRILRAIDPIQTSENAFVQLKNSGLVYGDGFDISVVEGCEQAIKRICGLLNIDLQPEAELEVQSKARLSAFPRWIEEEIVFGKLGK